MSWKVSNEVELVQGPVAAAKGKPKSLARQGNHNFFWKFPQQTCTWKIATKIKATLETDLVKLVLFEPVLPHHTVYKGPGAGQDASLEVTLSDPLGCAQVKNHIEEHSNADCAQGQRLQGKRFTFHTLLNTRVEGCCTCFGYWGQRAFTWNFDASAGESWLLSLSSLRSLVSSKSQAIA